MNYWLVKSEPYKYPWDQLLKDGRTYWDGVRNYQARNNLQAMKNGDQVLFYHSNEGLAVVGIARGSGKPTRILPRTTRAGSPLISSRPRRWRNPCL
jgi:predicted RNA-binding protein with PUA-like domain